MARKAHVPAESKTPDLPTKSPAVFLDEAQQLAAHQARLKAIDEDLELQNPFNLDSYVFAARDLYFGIEQRARTLGKVLFSIKAHCAHGEWLPALERIGMPERTARTYILVAKTIGDNKSKQLVADKLGSTKFLELIAEYGDDVDALAEDGMLDGRTLDDIDRMSANDVRKALRKERQERTEDKEANDEILARKDKKINDLVAKGKVASKAPFRAKAEQYMAEINELVLAHLSSGDTLRAAIVSLNDLETEHGENIEEDLMAQLRGHVEACRALVDTLADLSGA